MFHSLSLWQIKDWHFLYFYKVSLVYYVNYDAFASLILSVFKCYNPFRI